MATFAYRCRDAQGKLVLGRIQATDADELKESLFSHGFIPLVVKEVSETSIGWDDLIYWFRRVKLKELIELTRQFHILFRAGVSIDTILATLVRQTSSKTLAQALEKIRGDVAEGQTLSQAFGRLPKIFNELYIAMLAAGEEAGILEKGLQNLVRLLEREEEIRKGIKTATLYPKIVILVLACAILTLLHFVVPKFQSFYESYHAELPGPTQWLLAASHIVSGYWWLVLMVLGLAYFLYARFQRTKTGRFTIDKWRLELPVFGDLNVKIANARFGHIVCALYQSGLPMPRVLEIAANVIQNEAFAREIRRLKGQVMKGSTLAEAMGEGPFFSQVMREATAVGEKAGALDEMLGAVADHHELEVSHITKNLTTLLEPLLLIFIFGIVTIVALAIFLPVWNLSKVVIGH